MDDEGDDAHAPADALEQIDLDVLDAMANDDVFSPSHVDDEGICRGPQAAYRCRRLTDWGLLVKHAPGMYDLTDLGERVVDGEVDPADVDPPEE